MATNATATARYNSLSPVLGMTTGDFSLLSFKIGMYAGIQIIALGLTLPSVFRGLMPASSFLIQLQLTAVNVLWNLSIVVPRAGMYQLGSNALDTLNKFTIIGVIGFYFLLYCIPRSAVSPKSRFRWTAFLVSGLLMSVSTNILYSVAVYKYMSPDAYTVLSIWYQYVEVYVGVLLIFCLARYARFKYGSKNVGQLWDTLEFLSLEWMALTLFLSVLVTVVFLVSSSLEYDPDLNFAASVTVVKYYAAMDIAITIHETPDPRRTLRQKKLQGAISDSTQEIRENLSSIENRLNLGVSANTIIVETQAPVSAS